MRAIAVAVFAVVVCCGARAVADTHYVSKTGTNIHPYTTPETAAWEVQDATDAADEGDRVEIGPGTFTGRVELKPNTIIEGAGPKLTTVGSVIAADGCEIAHLSITGGEVGIACERASVLIHDCHIFACTAQGVACEYSRVALFNCRIFDNVRSGVFCELYSEVVVWGCEITSNGYQGVHVYYDSMAEVVDTVIRGNGSSGLYCYESSARVIHSLICGNGGGVYASGEIVNSTMADNIRPIVLAAGSSVSNSIIWNNDLQLEDPEKTTVYHSDTPLTHLSGVNANICADPLFVGWGAFNRQDNPIHVQANHHGEQEGTQARPFNSITAALRSYSYQLAAGSPCVRSWQNMGYYLHGVSPAESRSDSVRIAVGEGTYHERAVVVPGDIDLIGAGQHRTFVQFPPLPPSGMALPLLRMGTGVLVEGLTLRNVEPSLRSAGVYCGQGSTIRRCTISGFTGYSETALLLPQASTADSCTVCNNSAFGIATSSDASRSATILNCLVYGNGHGIWCSWPASSPLISNCTAVGNRGFGIHSHVPDANPTIVNCIVWGNGTDIDGIEASLVSHSNVGDEEFAGKNMNVSADPQFVNAEARDFRLKPSSPCIDAGDNTVSGLPDTDMAGMHRIMYGGKSLTVDMGAYEYYINDLEPGPEAEETTLTWSSLADRTYSIFYSHDLATWHLAEATFPSAGDTTTSWTDDGSKTGVAPSLVPRRFYRILENP
ncbi:right-handed parallel beta-helix repeat-containing protein [bacterium]|nr:right-handed parallel beta-helix repeat-containing protein [bacterium]